MVVKGLVLLAAGIAQALGFTSFLTNLRNRLGQQAHPEAQDGRHATAAMQDAGIKGFEQISKDIQLAAAQAVGGSGAESQDERANRLRQEILDALVDMNENEPEWIGQLKRVLEGVEAALTTLGSVANAASFAAPGSGGNGNVDRLSDQIGAPRWLLPTVLGPLGEYAANRVF